VKTSAAKPKVPAKNNKEPEPESEEDEEMEEKSEEEEPKPKAAASKKRAAPDSGFGETGTHSIALKRFSGFDLAISNQWHR
jgi:hypothetical protein